MKICIVEDDRSYRHLLESTLRGWNYDVCVTENGEQALRILAEPNPPQLLIADWVMPEIDGIELCHRIRAKTDAPYTYIILLSALGRTEDLVAGLEAGANDYLKKPCDLRELQARLQVGKRLIGVQNELVAQREATRQQALHDPLTRLWNRGAILELLDAELHRAHRRESALGVLIVDLDRFKLVNDTFGHLAGDCVLAEAAQRLSSGCRPYDMVGRYGGEEFLVLLPECDLSATLAVGERLRARVAAEPVIFEEQSIPVTLSGGATAYHGSEARIGLNDLIRRADAALYRAKNNGRNQILP